MVYYNEIDTFAAAWLRELIAEGFIAYGDVDERSIEEVRPDELKGYKQCHFFAGIGGWSLALRLAGVPDDYAVWTGSCPCQPFSVAGAHRGVEDERHLWPVFARLIAECGPTVVVGEQVATAVAHGWLDLVESDLEGCGYACGAAVLPAASVGAPHRRDRLYWGGGCAAWGTPVTSDAVGGVPVQAIEDPANFRSTVKNEYRVRLAFGATPSGAPARTGPSARLNPAVSRWLMGFPPDWDVCAVMAMPSSRKSVRRSSTPSSQHARIRVFLQEKHHE